MRSRLAVSASAAVLLSLAWALPHGEAGPSPAFGSAQTRAAAPPAAKPAAAPAKPDVQWQRYADPVERAFTIDVPAGWRVTGGTRRMNAVDIRVGVNVVSPDGKVSLFYGDVDVPVFTLPTPMLARAGLREGMIYSPGQGVQMRINRYENGETFASSWGAQRMAKGCTGVTRTTTKPRPDASHAIDMAYAQGGVKTTILAGEATFACTLATAAASGYVFAATELVQTQVSSLWDVKALVGFIAPSPRAPGAYGVLTHMVSSFAIDQTWQRRQDQTTRDFNRIVTQQNAIVSQAIIANGKALSDTSDRLFQSGQQRSKDTMAAIDKYDQYAVRGTSDFVNPSTGTRYGFLDNSYAHTYVSSDQRILQTDSETPPGAGWTEVKRAPSGRSPG